jgi:hypothetical protein
MKIKCVTIFGTSYNFHNRCILPIRTSSSRCALQSITNTVHTNETHRLSSSFIFHYMFRPYLFTIFRYKITCTEGKLLQRTNLFLYLSSTYVIFNFFYLITLFHSNCVYETSFRTHAAAKSNTLGSNTRHIPYEQSPASCCTTYHLAFLPIVPGPYFTLLAPNQTDQSATPCCGKLRADVSKNLSEFCYNIHNRNMS